jgi:hypothetical protein
VMLVVSRKERAEKCRREPKKASPGDRRRRGCHRRGSGFINRRLLMIPRDTILRFLPGIRHPRSGRAPLPS